MTFDSNPSTDFMDSTGLCLSRDAATEVSTSALANPKCNAVCESACAEEEGDPAWPVPDVRGPTRPFKDDSCDAEVPLIVLEDGTLPSPAIAPLYDKTWIVGWFLDVG